MVDIATGSTMPSALARYWLHGKGAAKIRWGMPNDWYRCTHLLRKYRIRDIKGTCSNLHKRALGVWPGQESPHLSQENEMAIALLAAAPLGPVRWLAPLAPIGVPTGDGRIFTKDALSFRRFPLPLSFIKTETSGHQGRIVVGRILGATVGPDEHGQEMAFGFGDFFNPSDIPEVSQALALVRGGVVGLSLDPGGLVRIAMSEDGEVRQFTSYKAGGATLVSIPAFENQYMLLGGPDDTFEDDDLTDEYMLMADGVDVDVEESQDGEGLPLAEQDCGCGDLVEEAELAVNSGGWRGLPIAARETPVDRDDALKRIAAWANGDASKLNRAFLWRHPQGEPGSVLSYRLPVGDIIGGKLTMVYHAIYAASALLEGAHGGLPNIPDSEKDQLRRVISAIYKRMAADFNDPDVKASWDRAVKRDNGVTKVEGKTDNKGDFAEEQMPLTELSADILVDADSDALVAAGGPVTPPASWFEHQEVATDPGIKVSAEGQVTGYLAAWKQCHMSVGRGRCVKAPRSQTGYQYFHLGSTQVDTGKRFAALSEPSHETIKVGRLTVGGGHADVSLGVIPATEHYDNAGTVVAVVRAHEDKFGIQVAGAIVPGATAEQVAALRRSPLSGDWRAVNRNLELVAALAVNVPGFPVFAEDEEGHEMALISSGFAGDLDDGADHEHDGLVTEVDGEEELAVDVDELVDKVISTLADQEAAKARAAQLARQQQVQAELEQSRRAERLKALTEVN